LKPSKHASPTYVAAFAEIAARIAATLADLPRRARPIRMYVAGGAALHLYVGERVSRDIDAAFSHRIALPNNLDVAFRDADGSARVLYFDRQYSDTLALLHEDSYDDSRPIDLPNIDPDVLEVRLLTPVDLAISKLGRFSAQDRDDIVTLARHRLIAAIDVRQRAEAALVAYVGDLTRVQGSIEIACRLIADESRRR
jgi:Nucleotidyltransferase of unknown function (DUF6036)